MSEDFGAPILEEQTIDSDIVFGREIAETLFLEIIPLILEHYREIAVDMGQPLEPDWEQYRLQDQAGFLRVYTARSKVVLVGYAVFFLRPHQHSVRSIQAFADALYIDPERRGIGAKFIRWCDDQLKLDGAKVVYHSVTPYCDFSPVLTRMGYELASKVFARRL